MIQTLTSLKLTGFVRNEGERRSRKVIVSLDLSNPKKLNIIRGHLKTILEHSLPELHPGQGRTKVVAK